ncbi:MAG: hypothetical protein WCV72_00235 [Patescibacteria group bacterium]
MNNANTLKTDVEVLPAEDKEIFKGHRVNEGSRAAARIDQVLKFLSKRKVNISREDLHELSTKIGKDFFAAHESDSDWYEGPDNYYQKGRGFEAIEIEENSVDVPGIQVLGVSAKNRDTGRSFCANPRVVCKSDNDKLLWMLLELLGREYLNFLDDGHSLEFGSFKLLLEEEQLVEKLQEMLARLRGREQVAKII